LVDSTIPADSTGYTWDGDPSVVPPRSGEINLRLYGANATEDTLSAVALLDSLFYNNAVRVVARFDAIEDTLADFSNIVSTSLDSALWVSRTIASDTPLPSGNVNSWAQLDSIRYNLSGTFTLGASLDSNSTGYSTYAAEWTPIGTFTGSIDGQGYTIEDLVVDVTDDNAGLFGLCNNATIIDIELVNVSVTSTANYVGGILGRGLGTTSIAESSVAGAISGSGTYTGGLAGACADTISNSFSTCTVDGATATGGLIGGSFAAIVNCYSTSDVTGTGSEAGGLIGRQTTSGTSVNSYATGDVDSGTQHNGYIGNNQWSSGDYGLDNCGWLNHAGNPSTATNNGTMTYTETTESWFYDSTSNIFDSNSPNWDTTTIWLFGGSAHPTLR